MNVKIGTNEEINKVILSHTEKLLVYYANQYKERPRGLIDSFLKFDSIKMAACLIIFMYRKNGVLEELRNEKDFSEWVDKQSLADKWKPVMNNFLLILWAVTK